MSGVVLDTPVKMLAVLAALAAAPGVRQELVEACTLGLAEVLIITQEEMAQVADDLSALLEEFA